MGWIEYLLIVAGSSLEIFVAMECQGSLIQKVKDVYKRQYQKRVFAACFLYNFIYKRNVTAYLSMQFKVDGLSLIHI